MSDALLALTNVSAGYGDVRVLRDVTLEVGAGEIVTLLGANGAGKTTLLRCVSRLLDVTAGTIALNDDDITRAPSSRVVERGVAHVPEGRRLWPEMTVEENLMLGAYPRRARNGISDARERVFALFPRIKERRRQVAGTLSGGEQQMVAIARGLMSQPALLMLDEPSLGLAPLVMHELFAAIAQIQRSGVTVLLVEQNVKQALEIATRGYVLEEGEIRASGTRAELLASDEIQKAYLGL
ncbi:MAG TPA: ABC transporter ATP-binding protein [Candidatus Binatus sp.]|nr:ABC transporter ATP-binding protein [Candidatus Binatus sp.]